MLCHVARQMRLTCTYAFLIPLSGTASATRCISATLWKWPPAGPDTLYKIMSRKVVGERLICRGDGLGGFRGQHSSGKPVA
jgi:hypothetical protein